MIYLPKQEKYIETECSDSFLMPKKKKNIPESEEEFRLKYDVFLFKKIYDEKLKILSNEDVENFPDSKLYSQHFFTEF